MGQNFCASESDSDMFCPITCSFIALMSCRSKPMSASVTVGLMTLCPVTCCPCTTASCVFAPAAAIPPPHAVATTAPARNATANPAGPVILLFIILLPGQHSTDPASPADLLILH